jgi:hypothetical protein
VDTRLGITTFRNQPPSTRHRHYVKNLPHHHSHPPDAITFQNT